MLAIEEPELYQHPLQARTLAAALRDLARVDSRTKTPQIAYSTHSEHFVHPTLFEDLRIVSSDQAGHPQWWQRIQVPCRVPLNRSGWSTRSRRFA
jgi:putative ATP-dependent endonuclease of the OLD family